jgi:hypothetical protein
MIAKFEFHLPEDEREYEIMSKSLKTQSFLCDFSEQLRSWYKYHHDFKNADDALDKIREEFHSLLDKYQINIDL